MAGAGVLTGIRRPKKYPVALVLNICYNMRILWGTGHKGYASKPQEKKRNKKMKIHKDGMTLMKDTGSLTNALMENKTDTIKVGDTFAELMWTDRKLWKVTEVISPKAFMAERVETELRNGWEDGTEFPKKDERGEMITDGQPMKFIKKRKYWYCGGRIHWAWGATTGYRDPSF